MSTKYRRPSYYRPIHRPQLLQKIAQPLELTGNFDLGVAGNTIQTSDPGSVNPWNDRGFSADGTLTYSNVHPKYGNLCCEMVLSATPGTPFVAWNVSSIGVNQDNIWGRMYLSYLNLPSNSAFPIRGFNFFGSLRAWEIIILSTGLVSVRDNAGTGRGTGSIAIPTGSWFRLEYHVINSPSNGFIEAKIFHDPNSVTETETITSSGTFSTLESTALIRMGEVAALNASNTVRMDNLQVNNAAYPGPVPFEEQLAARTVMIPAYHYRPRRPIVMPRG